MRTVAPPLPMITVPLVLRRFFDSIEDAPDVNDLRGSLLEIALPASARRSQSFDIESLAESTPPSAILRFRAGSCECLPFVALANKGCFGQQWPSQKPFESQRKFVLTFAGSQSLYLHVSLAGLLARSS